MVSYEVSIGFIIVTVIVCAGSFNLTEIVLAQKNMWFMVPLLPMFIMFSISALAETNRHPFDLPEAEAELVSGYNVEYSAMGFALFFLGEYANMLLMSALTTIIPSTTWFNLKMRIGVTFFIVMRAALPRFRYDQLMWRWVGKFFFLCF